MKRPLSILILALMAATPVLASYNGSAFDLLPTRGSAPSSTKVQIDKSGNSFEVYSFSGHLVPLRSTDMKVPSLLETKELIQTHYLHEGLKDINSELYFSTTVALITEAARSLRTDIDALNTFLTRLEGISDGRLPQEEHYSSFKARFSDEPAFLANLSRLYENRSMTLEDFRAATARLDDVLQQLIAEGTRLPHLVAAAGTQLHSVRNNPVNYTQTIRFHETLPALNSSAARFGEALDKVRSALAGIRPWKDTPAESVMERAYARNAARILPPASRLDAVASNLTTMTASFGQAALAVDRLVTRIERSSAKSVEVSSLNHVGILIFVLDKTSERSADHFQSFLSQLERIATAEEQAWYDGMVGAKETQGYLVSQLAPATSEPRQLQTLLDELDDKLSALQMNPNDTLFRVMRDTMKKHIDAAEATFVSDPLAGLQEAVAAMRSYDALRVALPGESSTVLRGKLQSMIDDSAADHLTEAEEDLTRADRSFYHGNEIEGLRALIAVADCMATGKTLRKVAQNTGEVLLNKEDLQVTVAPIVTVDPFQNPWLFAGACALLLLPLLIVIFTLRRREIKHERENDAFGAPVVDQIA